MTDLDTLLADMDVPKFRRDTSQLGNLMWLERNLAINNGQNPNFHKVMVLVHEKMRSLKLTPVFTLTSPENVVE